MPFSKVRDTDNKVIVFDSDVFESPTSEWFTADFWQQRGKLTGRADGRGTTYFFSHQNREYVLRHYLRGGLPGKILSDQFFYGGIGLTRAWRELHLLHQMRTWDLPAPNPVAALVERRGLYYRSDLITSRIPGAKDLHAYLCKGPLNTQTWFDVGQTIARFHQRQVFHHDLNIHNIMMDGEGNIWLIDFDKCRVRKAHSWKMKNLARLKRSLTKEQGLQTHYHFNDESWQALLEGYQSIGEY